MEANALEGPSQKLKHENILKHFDLGGFSPNEVVEELDILYKDPANNPIPVAVMCTLALDKLKGLETDDALQRLMLKFRRDLSPSH